MLIGDNKVYLIGGSGFAIVVPPQSQRCIFWNGLMLKVFFAFLLMTPQALHEGALWHVFLGMVAMNVLLSCRTHDPRRRQWPFVLRITKQVGLRHHCNVLGSSLHGPWILYRWPQRDLIHCIFI